MTKPPTTPIDTYISTHPAPTQRALAALRTCIRKAAPGAAELMNYNIPAFALVPGGKRDSQIMIAGYPKHVGFYPGPEVIEAFADQLADYAFSKGSIQFPLDRPIPKELVARMVKHRLAQLRTSLRVDRPERPAAAAGSLTRAPGARLRRSPMPTHRIYTMPFASVYPLYVQKAEKKGRTRAEVDQVIRWLTGYTAAKLAAQIKQGKDFQTFFREAPALNANADKVTGVICGVRIEELDDPLMRNIRRLDKLVDELAKGRPMEKILRA